MAFIPASRCAGEEAWRAGRRQRRTARRFVRAWITVAIVLLFLVTGPGQEPRSSASEPSPVDRVVTFRTDATVREIEAAGARVLEEYGAFSIARGPDRSVQRLEHQGHYAGVLSASPTLQLAGARVDLRSLPRGTASEWAIDGGRGTTTGVVHFYAPIKPAWVRELEDRGIDVLRYLPSNALLVRGPRASIQDLALSEYVDWIGPYSAPWKIRPDLSADGLVDARVVVLPGDHPESVVAWLNHRGIRGTARSETGTGIMGTFGTGDFRWVRARIPSSLVASLARLPSVEFIDSVPRVRPWNEQTAWVLQTNTTVDTRYWRSGLDGRGQHIGIADTGLDYDGPPFRHSSGTIALGDIHNTTDTNRRKVVRYVNMGVLTGLLTWPGGGGAWDPWSIQDCTGPVASTGGGHGTAVASTLAGNDTGIGASPNDGGAPAAKIYLQDVGAGCPESDLPYVPEDYAELFGPTDLVYNDPIAPVRVHSNSWGSEMNVYDVQARMVDAFVWAHPDLTILFAAGNCVRLGCPLPGSVGTPGTAKNILTVGGALNPDPGAPGNQNDLSGVSARGPTTDGRIKPTILTIIDGDSAQSDGDPQSLAGLADGHWAGTSYSSPAAAAAAAIVRQYFVEGWSPAGRSISANGRMPSAALVRAVMIASGQQVTGTGTVSRSPTDTWPNQEQGFGRVLLSKVLPLADAGDAFRTQVVDEPSSGLLTGDAAAQTFYVGTPGPLKVVLAWTDYPGTLGAGKALVNDLDLEVRAPDGTVYRGNHFGPFARGESLAGGTFDATNVEEAVLLRSAMAGAWTVRVIGANVPVGPQPFALVAAGNLDGSYGRVTLDRLAYSERDTIRIAVEDETAGAVVVHVTSGLEATGEDVTLTRGVAGEVWRGTIDTAFGTPSADAILQVREADTISVTYADGSPAHTATTTATVLASGPTVHDVAVTSIGATTATIEWVTEEPATSEVQYGTVPTALDAFANSTDLVRHHAVSLRALSPGTRYYFDVRSRGRLANATVDSNQGTHHRFETPRLGDVLVVLGGPSFPPEREASYAAALDENGWTWSLWNVADLGLPNWTVLRDRRIVIWQVGLEQYPPFNSTERDLIRTYLERGGRLLVTSHDAAWALTASDSSFATPESASWVRSVLKASFVCDPVTIGEVRGVGGDPISGAFVGGVGYAPHREGGADDQITANAAGGTSTTSWTDAQVVSPECTSGRAAGLRWVSSAPNGTVGDGVWGGNESRLVYFAFELTGLDASATDLNPASSTRSAILDAALRWLVSSSSSSLDRDHPDVAIIAPNRGSFVGPSIQIDWIAAADGLGVGIANFSLDVSADDGVTWSPIATLPGSDRSYTWDVGGTPNGDRYRLRITARDDGSPSFEGDDTTDGRIEIRRTNGDTIGPSVWEGSVRIGPRPPGAARLATIRGTADDRRSGGSAIAVAELFLQGSEPPLAAAGTGLPMLTSDARFDAPLENVSWLGGIPVAPGGSTCAWVHSQDGAGNWGPYLSTCFVTIADGPDDVPPASAIVDELRASGAANLSIGWRPSYEDGLYGGAIAYRVYRATSLRGPFVNVSGPIPVNGSARYAFVDLDSAANASEYFYEIESIDEAGNVARSASLAAKVRLSFAAGLNLLGAPLRLTDPEFLRVFAGRAWAGAWTYDACGGSGWSSVLPTDPVGLSVPLGRGVWVNGTASDSVTLLGVIEPTNRVRLCTGWNLIALPGLAEGMTAAALMAATRATRVQGFDLAGPYHLRDLGSAEVLLAGRGYWVHVPANVDWIVPGT